MRPWEKNLEKLKQFYRRYGHTDVSLHEKSDRLLVQWVENMRSSNRKLPKELRDELLKLNFNFEFTQEKDWGAMYNQLISYWQKHGHTYIPFDEKLEALAKWAQDQRNSKSRLNERQIKLLDELGFDWAVNSQNRNSWMLMFEELKKFKERYGHTKVVETDKQHRKLSTWVHNLRARPHWLDAEQRKKLNALGFLWREDLKRLKENQWTARYRQLLDFKKRFGHCNVPIKWKENKELAVWVSWHRLREKNKRGLLPERKKLLDKIGFSWSEDLVKQYDDGWNGMFKRLKAFRSEYGHMRVPATGEDRDLNKWVQSQRIMYREGYLPVEKQKKFDSIGFILSDVRGITWEKKYRQLKQFKRQYGTLEVPRKNAGHNAGLAEWQSVQRQNRAKGILSKDRIKKLDAIGFDWTIVRPQIVWTKKYNELAAFKKAFKHLQVPKNRVKYKSLVKWIIRQRENYRKGKLSEARIKMLDLIGFEWPKPHEAIWMNKYRKLAAFKKKYKHLLVPGTVLKIHDSGLLAKKAARSLQEWYALKRPVSNAG